MNKSEIVMTERKRWVFFGIPWTFTVYNISEDLLTIDTGFFKTEENDCYMYKITDAKLTRSLFERIFGLGTVVCYTGDTTDKVISLLHIKNSMEVKDYIIKASEAARMRRRTVNMQDITAGDISDIDPAAL